MNGSHDNENEVLSPMQVFFKKLKRFFIKWVLPIGTAIVSILYVLSQLKGGGGFSFLGKLKYGGQKKKLEEHHKVVMEKVTANNKKIEVVKTKIASNDGDIAKHEESLKQIEAERLAHLKELEKASTNIRELDKLAQETL